MHAELPILRMAWTNPSKILHCLFVLKTFCKGDKGPSGICEEVAEMLHQPIHGLEMIVLHYAALTDEEEGEESSSFFKKQLTYRK